jgi:[protein-PII] uridylyltransferase
LFHDIAKGRGGDHSALGAEDAVEFCQSHGLSNFDTHLVAWLVRNHLIMSSTAQRKDIYDLDVVREFAKIVGDQMHLDYLFLLTVADIRGTNPDLWNDWKASLLSQLYVATRGVLHRGDSPPPDKDAQIRSTRRDARKLLAKRSFPENEINMLWDSLSDNYFLRHRPEEVAWHSDVILSTDLEDLPIVAVRSFDERGGSAVFVYEKDVDNLFAVTTAALNKLRLDVLDARIITSHGGYTLDTYTVVEADTAALISDPNRIQEVCSKIRGAIRNGEIARSPMKRAAIRKIKHFAIPAQVKFDYDKVHNCTVMEVVATDQPGLLSKIGRALQECDVRLHDARIATFGARVEDYFYITDRKNRKLRARDRIPQLQQAVIDALSD